MRLPSHACAGSYQWCQNLWRRQDSAPLQNHCPPPQPPQTQYHQEKTNTPHTQVYTSTMQPKTLAKMTSFDKHLVPTRIGAKLRLARVPPRKSNRKIPHTSEYPREYSHWRNLLVTKPHIQQSLIQGEALGNALLEKIRHVHEYIQEYYYTILLSY